jgi:hypothetical protein
MKGRKILVVIACFIMVLYGCNLADRKGSNTAEKDSFYTSKGGLDRPRIPLIKPYELQKVSANEWRMELQTPDLALSIHNISGVNVSQGRILLHSNGGTEIRFEDFNVYKEAWFVIDPGNQKESAFVNYAKYKDTLLSIGLADTTLLTPDALYHEFNSSGTLKWPSGK